MRFKGVCIRKPGNLNCYHQSSSVSGINLILCLGLKIPSTDTAIFKIDNQRGPTVQRKDLCSMLCDRLNGKGVWGRMDTCIWMAESLRCSPETITTLLVGYTPIQNKKFKKFVFL